MGSAAQEASPLMGRLSLPPPAGGAWPSWARPPSPPPMASLPPQAGGSPTCSKGQMCLWGLQATEFLKQEIAFSRSTRFPQRGSLTLRPKTYSGTVVHWNSGTLAELEVARSEPEMISSRSGEEAQVLQAKQLLAETLSPLLVEQPGKRARGKQGSQAFQGTHQSPPGLPRSNHVLQHSIQDAQLSPHNDEVPIDDQPYRTTPLVLPHAKTIHDTVPPAKFLNQHQHADGQQPYRSSTVALPAPRTINDLAPGRGAPVYQQYRGPQFNTQMAKPAHNQKMGLPVSVYNSPVPLYSQDNLAEAMAENPGFVQTNKPALPTVNTATISKPHESETFRMILESEMGGAKNHTGIGSKQFERQLSGQERASSQQSDRSSDAGRPGLDPVMKNNSINQSASFKKVMYSVMGETEF